MGLYLRSVGWVEGQEANMPDEQYVHVTGCRPAPGSLEQLVDCSGGEDISEDSGFERKAVAMLSVLKDQKASRTIVFCNKLTTCRKVICCMALAHTAFHACL